VKSARILLTNFHKRGTGDCRYAVKFLRKDVRDVPEKYAVGTVDLVIEGMFLASLSHPNIIKVRGLPEGGVESLCDEVGYRNGYFLVLDRLYNTLSYQMYNVWAKNHVKTITKKYGFLTSRDEKKKRNKDLAERLKVALDMSAALKYLHSKNLLYRDLKPENLGFDGKWSKIIADVSMIPPLSVQNRVHRCLPTIRLCIIFVLADSTRRHQIVRFGISQRAPPKQYGQEGQLLALDGRHSQIYGSRGWSLPIV
jgi:serine/threonine protein kinase